MVPSRTVKTTPKIRNSSIELLKIISMFFICIYHVVDTSQKVVYPGGSPIPSYDPALVATGLFLHLGYIANCIFVICSTYYLIRSEKTKLEKVVGLMLDTTIISISFLIGYLAAGYQLDYKSIVNNIIPNLTFDMNWFIPTYILLYVSHPLLNKIIYSIKPRTHLIIVIFSAIFLSALMYTGHFFDVGRYASFFVIYLTASFFFLHRKDFCSNVKKNVILLVGSLVAVVGIFLFINYCGTICPWLAAKYKVQANMLNPFVFLVALAAVNLFSTKEFYSKSINYLSSLTLYIYVIHENKLFRSQNRLAMYQYFLSVYNSYILMDILIGMILFVCGTIAAIVYKETIARGTKKLSVVISNGITNAFNKLCTKLDL